MLRLFISHSSVNTAEAVALRDWLGQEGWSEEVFLDVDPNRGIAAGERWERQLHEAANRCEAVIFLVSRAWLASRWCLREFNLARRMNKRLFGVLIEELKPADLPADLTGWQLVHLAAGTDHVIIRVVVPITHEEAHVTFSLEGLRRLRHGLERAGLSAKYFAWPPSNDPDRTPYPGLRPLESEDAGIFFGRDASIIEAIDALRGLQDTVAPRMFVILGASGAGKSSFLRAGLLPRLLRDDRHFLPLPIVRPERAAITGRNGLLSALEAACTAAGLRLSRADLRAAVDAGSAALRPVLKQLAEASTPAPADDEAQPTPPTIIVAIDQGEELFFPDGAAEARALLAIVHDLLMQDGPAVIAVVTIRSDAYEHLQFDERIADARQTTFSLPPLPRGSYAEVIKGPARRLEETTRRLEIEDSLVDELLRDMEAGGAKDALPLLAFTLERLYVEHGGDGDLRLAEYRALGGIKGSIEAAIEHAFAAADADPAVPRDRAARLALLRRGLIPWLAGIDPDTGAPRRRVARISEVPAEARPLIQHLVSQRLLATDLASASGERTIEPVHEALLRQWGLLQGWLAEDAAYLAALTGIQRAARDWAANGKDPAWLAHVGARLRESERLNTRPDLAASLEPTDREYLAACRAAERSAGARKRQLVAAIALLAAAIITLGGWYNWSRLATFGYWLVEVRPYVLGAEAERHKKTGETFRECGRCPDMVVIPPGKFDMGSRVTEIGHRDTEEAVHSVTIAQPLAVAKHETTFDEWALCVARGGCADKSDEGWGRGDRPVINVTWEDAHQYVMWLSGLTGREYRLLSETEWEYAARANNPTRYSFGDDDKQLTDNAWDADNSGSRTNPVGHRLPNGFGLFDMYGNVAEWCADYWHERYGATAPRDQTAWVTGDSSNRVVRGGAWYSQSGDLRSASRSNQPANRGDNGIGFRVARSLLPPQ